MKPEQKPFVVEFKNRRRLSRKETSIWGRIDLKAAGDDIAAQQVAAEAGVLTGLHTSATAPIEDAAEISA